MNILILTANTGGGHNSAAAAIADLLDREGVPCTVENALRFVPKPTEDLIVNSHTLASRFVPKLYGAGYEISEEIPGELVFHEFARYAPTLRNFIIKGGYDTVICVHVFAALMMTALRQKGKLDVKQYFVATDYTCSPSVEQVEADAVFIPKGVRPEFLHQGLRDEVLYETGIPVKLACYEPMDKRYAREELFAEMRLSPDEKVVLIAPQCLSFSDIRNLAQQVHAHLPEAVFAVICGKGNQRMRTHLAALEDPTIRPLSFTTKMTTWMKAADVLITKPGGLTSTEAVSCGVPLIMKEVVPGLETHNQDFLANRGCGCVVSSAMSLFLETLRLLSDEDAAARMVADQRRMFSTHAVEDLMAEVFRQAGYTPAAKE